jgi:CBS domain-containing protein
VDTFLQETTGSHMTHDVEIVTRYITMHELSSLFSLTDFNSYPVEEDGRVIGIVSKFDFLANFVFTPMHMVPRYRDLMKRTVGDVMTPDFIYVGTATKLTRVLQLMVDHRLQSMPVIEADQRLVGMISRRDVIRALQRDDDETQDGLGRNAMHGSRSRPD